MTNNSAVNCPILLKCATFVHYWSTEAAEWWNLLQTKNKMV